MRPLRNVIVRRVSPVLLEFMPRDVLTAAYNRSAAMLIEVGEVDDGLASDVDTDHIQMVADAEIFGVPEVVLRQRGKVSSDVQVCLCMKS